MASWRQVEVLASKPETVLDKMGQMMVEESRQAFTQQSFDGQPWPERYPNQGDGLKANVAGILNDLSRGQPPSPKRFQSRPALIDSGRLRDSIEYEVSDNQLIVGSPLSYSGMHLEGGKSKQQITQSMKSGLVKFLAGNQEYFDLLSFLLEKDEHETNVVARPFLGVTDTLLKKMVDVIKVRVEKL